MSDVPTAECSEQAPSKTKKRIESVDILKGLTIIAVCLLHMGNNATPWTQKLTVTVGIFFVLAGYFYKPHKGLKYNVIKRTRQLLIPFLLYGAICITAVFVFLSARGEELTLYQLAEAYFYHVFDNWCLDDMATLTLPQNPMAYYALPMWFIIRLYVSELIMFFIADWALESAKRTIVSVTALITVTVLWGTFVGIHLPMQFNTCFAISALLLTGAYAKKSGIIGYIENKWNTSKYWIIMATLIAVFILLYLLGVSESRLYRGFFYKQQLTETMWMAYLWIVEVLCLTFVALVVSFFVSKIPVVSKCLITVGEHTLMILCFHFAIGYMLLALMGISLRIPIDAVNTNVLERYAVTVVSIVLCLILDFAKDYLIKRYGQYIRKGKSGLPHRLG